MVLQIALLRAINGPIWLMLLIQIMKIHRSYVEEIFKKGIIVYINGTKQILHTIKENSLNYFLTSKINQHTLENVCQIRSRV